MNKDPASGRFLPGNKANPGGHNGMLKGYTTYSVRLRQLSELYDTYQLVALYKDKLRFGKLNPLDAQCVTALVDGIYAKNRFEVMQGVASMIEGKPKGDGVDVNVSVNGEVKHTHGISETTKRMLESRIAGLAERGSTGPILEQPTGNGSDSSSVRLEQLLSTSEATSS